MTSLTPTFGTSNIHSLPAADESDLSMARRDMRDLTQAFVGRTGMELEAHESAPRIDRDEKLDNVPLPAPKPTLR